MSRCARSAGGKRDNRRSWSIALSAHGYEDADRAAFSAPTVGRRISQPWADRGWHNETFATQRAARRIPGQEFAGGGGAISAAKAMRSLVLVLGDQLDAESSAFDGFDPKRDAIWMAEVAAESEHVWASKSRIAVFLSAMRHFRDAQKKLGRRVNYTELDAAGNTQSLAGELARAVAELKPKRLVMTEAGEWRVQERIAGAAQAGFAWHQAELESALRHVLGRKG